MTTLTELQPRTGRSPELDALLRRIEATYRPTAVVLYGSRARSDAGPDSD